MADTDANILWPAIGCPQSVSKIGEVVVIAGPGAAGADDNISARLFPTGTSGASIALELTEMSLEPIGKVKAPGRWPEWLSRRYPVVMLLRFQVLQSPHFEGRRTLLYDLELEVGDRSLTKPNSVYFSANTNQDLKLLTATDIHVARRWQEIHDDVLRVFPPRQTRPARHSAELGGFDPADAWTHDTFADSFVDANRNFARFISIANALWNRGDLDLIVLSGDLIDYKFSDDRGRSGGGFQQSEWSHFEELLLGQSSLSERLLVPMYTALGNHEYRLHPYKIQIYGLRHSGLADEQTAEYLKRTEQWMDFKYRFSDLNALRINTGNQHSLDFYYEKFNPFAAYGLDLGAARLIVLDSGPDFYCERSNMLGGRWRRFFSSLLSSSGGPRTTGATSEQITFLETQLDEAPDDQPAVIVSHAPVLSPSSMPRVDAGEVPLNLRIDSTFSSNAGSKETQMRFEWMLHRRGLDAGAMFHNQLPILESLRSEQRDVVALAGHNHRQLEMALDKSDGQLYAGRYSEGGVDLEDTLKKRVLLVQTSALGHVKRSNPSVGYPAYRSVMISGSKIRDITPHPLGEKPFDVGFDDWTVTREGSLERITFIINRDKRVDLGDTWTTVVAWLRGEAGSLPATRLNAMQVRLEPQSVIVAYHDRREAEEGGYISFVAKNSASVEMTLQNRPKSVPIAFLFERQARVDSGIEPLSLRWHHRVLK
ncbi:MAG: hypothetical protein GY725_20775 [bacterium]|nr:hypothetical protein [bacterium]